MRYQIVHVCSIEFSCDWFQLLDVLIAKLNDTEEYTRNGIFSVNFVEASLVIQSAAQLYGKKVDLLWDHVLEFHERMISYDK